MEVWKSLNVENYPIKLEPNNRVINNLERTLRPTSTRIWNQDARTVAERESFSRNAAKLWNNLPNELKNITKLSKAKNQGVALTNFNYQQSNYQVLRWVFSNQTMSIYLVVLIRYIQ